MTTEIEFWVEQKWGDQWLKNQPGFGSQTAAEDELNRISKCRPGSKFRVVKVTKTVNEEVIEKK